MEHLLSSTYNKYFISAELRSPLCKGQTEQPNPAYSCHYNEISYLVLLKYIVWNNCDAAPSLFLIHRDTLGSTLKVNKNLPLSSA
jgi:hypothetical protein